MTSRSRIDLQRMLAATSAAAIALLLAAAETRAESSGQWLEFDTPYFDKPIVRLKRVFTPLEAAVQVLPFMKAHAEFFAGKTVLEIGTGSGIVSAYAAKLGAKRVVATDIDPKAVRSALKNAKRLGYTSIIDARLVPTSDTTAFSVIAEDETFDVIVSNPPYALNLNAPRNTALVDTGDLGFSIIRGFEGHVRPGGLQLLFYGSLFYHQVMVKFARYEGFEVRHNLPTTLVAWEASAIFNNYLVGFLKYQGLDPNAFHFMAADLFGIRVEVEPEPLFPEISTKAFPGWIAVWRPSEAAPE